MWAKHVGEKNWLPCPFWFHWTSQNCNWHLEPHNLIKIQGLSQHSPPSINTPPIHPDTTLPTHYRYYYDQMSTDSWLMINRYVSQYSILHQHSTDMQPILDRRSINIFNNYYSSSPNGLWVNSGRMGYWLRGHEGERNNCFSKIQLVGQKYRDKTTLASKTQFSCHCFGFQSRGFSLLVGYNI